MTCPCGTPARTDNDSGVCDRWPACEKGTPVTAATAPKVTRWESNTARFGRVVTYRVKIGNVTVAAERMVGLNDYYSVSTHVGRCGMSHVSHPVRVDGGHGVSAAVLAAGQAIVAAKAHAKPHTLCTDPTACKQEATS